MHSIVKQLRSSVANKVNFATRDNVRKQMLTNTGTSLWYYATIQLRVPVSSALQDLKISLCSLLWHNLWEEMGEDFNSKNNLNQIRESEECEM